MVPFTIACGECFFCQRGLFSGCERTNPDRRKRAEAVGPFACGAVWLFAPARRLRGGQAEYLRVPLRGRRADQGARTGLSDEQVLFLSDIFPTGYMAAEFCDIKPGEQLRSGAAARSAQFAIRSAFLLGAERVIAIDTVPERLAMAREAGARPSTSRKSDIYDRIQELTDGRGADACIDAVGTEPRRRPAPTPARPRQGCSISRRRTGRTCCGRRSTAAAISASCPSSASIGGYLDKIPMGSAINRGLTFRMAQTPVQHYLPKLLERIENGEIDPSFVITHRGAADAGPALYKTFRDKQDGCIKVVLKP